MTDGVNTQLALYGFLATVPRRSSSAVTQAVSLPGVVEQPVKSVRRHWSKASQSSISCLVGVGPTWPFLLPPKSQHWQACGNSLVSRKSVWPFDSLCCHFPPTPVLLICSLICGPLSESKDSARLSVLFLRQPTTAQVGWIERWQLAQVGIRIQGLPSLSSTL